MQEPKSFFAINHKWSRSLRIYEGGHCPLIFSLSHLSQSSNLSGVQNDRNHGAAVANSWPAAGTYKGHFYQVLDLVSQSSVREQQLEISTTHLSAIFDIIKKYEYQNHFGLHLIHKHDEITEDEVMFGIQLQSSSDGWWTKPTPFSELPTENMYGKIFAVAGDSLLPYEWRKGNTSAIPGAHLAAFLDAFVQYLRHNKLTKTFGLERLDGQQVMSEFILNNGNGTIMLPSKPDVKSHRTTGWAWVDNEIKKIDHHAETNTGTHRVFVSKNPEEGDVMQAVEKLGAFDFDRRERVEKSTGMVFPSVWSFLTLGFFSRSVQRMECLLSVSYRCSLFLAINEGGCIAASGGDASIVVSGCAKQKLCYAVELNIRGVFVRVAIQHGAQQPRLERRWQNFTSTS